MELNIIEDKKNKLVMELKGTDNTICNALKNEINNDEHVKISTYSVKHPLISSPQVIVESDGEGTPREVILNAIQRLKKNNDRFRKEVSKEIK